MQASLLVQIITFVAGFAAFGLGLFGITRSLKLQKLLMSKQEQGLDSHAIKQDPQVSETLRRLRRILVWAMLMAVCSVAIPYVARLF